MRSKKPEKYFHGFIFFIGNSKAAGGILKE
jgi:hypothetical protein